MSTELNSSGTPINTPTTIVLQQPKESLFGRFGKFLLIALCICALIIAGLSAQYQSYFSEPNGPQEKYHSLSKTATQKIAIIEATGAIMEGDDFVKKQIDRIEKDPNVVAIVLRVNSPGGTVTYSDYLYHHLQELIEEKEIPMVVSMGSICASGGYYLSMAVGEQEEAIFAEPTTWTGSIGVIIPHYNLGGLFFRMGVVEDSVKSGPLKEMGTLSRQMTKEEREVFQELVDESFDNFKEIVKSGRPAFRDDEEGLEAVTTGQIFTAEQALENGLIDKIGFIESAIERAAILAGVSTDSVRCVKYDKPVGPLDALMLGEAKSASQSPINLRNMVELATPRAYYLWTSLPSLLEVRQSLRGGPICRRAL